MYLINKDYWKVQTSTRPMWGIRFAILIQDNSQFVHGTNTMAFEISFQIIHWYIESMYWFKKRGAANADSESKSAVKRAGFNL